MSRKGGTPKRAWQPMERATRVPMTDERKAFLRDQFGEVDVDQVLAEVEAAEMWMNDRYTVSARRRADGTVESLSIRRNDRKAAHDWRHFQQIKNEIAGPEVEAVELYPAMSRLMDTSNQYWLFVLPPGQAAEIGYEVGAVADADDVAHGGLGSVQRPLPEEWVNGPYNLSVRQVTGPR